MKAFIEANFKMLDINGDGVVSAEEYRYNCITRIAVDDIQIVDEAFNKMLNVSLKKYIFLRIKNKTHYIPHLYFHPCNAICDIQNSIFNSRIILFRYKYIILKSTENTC